MKQVKSQTKLFFYILLGLILLRPSLDIFSQYEFQIHHYLPSLNLNIIIGGLVFLFCLVYCLRHFKTIWRTPLFFSILIFLILTFLSIFYAPDKLAGGQEFIRLATIFLLYLLAYQLITSQKDFLLLLKVILVSYIIPALLAFYQFIFGLGLPDDFGGFQRIFGTFAHPNPFAFYTIFVLGLLIVLALSEKISLWPKEKKSGLWRWSAVVILVFLLLATYSRSALACLFIFLILFGLLKYRRLLLLALIIFAAAYFLFPAFQQRFWELITLDPSGSVVWRFKLWQDMLPIFLWQPWFGHGLDSFSQLNEFYRGFKFGSLEAHNDYLKLLVENGIVGLASYGIIIIGLLTYLWHAFRKTEEKYKNLGLGLLIISLSLFGAGFFDNILRATALQWNLWILLGAWLKINFDRY